MTREKEIYKVTLLGSAVNVVLVAFKFVAGVWGHSAAMMADAVHSVSDFVTDMVVLAFVRISHKPKDKSHDYGHGKYETLATTLIGVALFAVAAGIFIEGAKKIAIWARGGELSLPGKLGCFGIHCVERVDFPIHQPKGQSTRLSGDESQRLASS